MIFNLKPSACPTALFHYNFSAALGFQKQCRSSSMSNRVAVLSR